MKLYKAKRIIAGIMASALLISIMSGCGKTDNGEQKTAVSSTTQEESKVEASTDSQTTQETVQEEDNSITYPLEEKVKLTLAIVEEAALTANASNIGETPFGKAWQEATGVELEIMQMADSTAMNLMFASGDLPDIILYQFNSYSGGTDKAVKDKVIEPLDDYMEYAPDLQAVFDNNEDWYKEATTADGQIIGFPFIREDAQLRCSSGIMYRKDFLEKLDMDTPETLDEFYNYLVALKEELDIEAPFSPQRSWFFDRAFDGGVMTSAFGLVNTNFYQIDGTVYYGAYQEELKDMLTFMNKLYNEGLLDPNFQTMNFNTMGANFMNGISGACISSTGSGIGTYMNAMADDPEFDIAPGASLVANKGDTPMYGQYDNALTGVFAVITPDCKNKEAAVKFLNYGYTEEGKLLFNYGIEGESYTMVNGDPVYTDLIMNNPDGLSVTNARAQYDRSWASGPFVQDIGVLQVNALPCQQEAVEIWSSTDAANYALPRISVAEEDLAEYTRLMSDIKTYRSEMWIKYITGVESLDNFESEYLATLKSMGIEDAIEMQQKALDNFYAK